MEPKGLKRCYKLHSVTPAEITWSHQIQYMPALLFFHCSDIWTMVIQHTLGKNHLIWLWLDARVNITRNRVQGVTYKKALERKHHSNDRSREDRLSLSRLWMSVFEIPKGQESLCPEMIPHQQGFLPPDFPSTVVLKGLSAFFTTPLCWYIVALNPLRWAR
jgi:hypothetical protein